MSKDIRSDTVRYYDYNPHFPDDISFYAERIPSPDADVLELGCGTGRIIIPLSQYCKSIYGIDLSKAMIAICRDKLCKQGISGS